MRIDKEKGVIFLEFGVAVTWLAFTADEAEQWGNGILKLAKQLRDGT